MQLADQEARRLGHEYIGTEHVLLGLVKSDAGVAVDVLRTLGVSPEAVVRDVGKIAIPGPHTTPATGRLPHTPRAKKVVEYAIAEARELDHNYVGTEHLLLGLLREQEGVAGQVLMMLGLSLHATRNEVARIRPLGTHRADVQAGSPVLPISMLSLMNAEQTEMLRALSRQLTEKEIEFAEAQNSEEAARCRECWEMLRGLFFRLQGDGANEHL